MGRRKDPFCVFDKIYKENDYTIYNHKCDILEHRFSYYQSILKLNDCYIKYNDNEDCDQKYTYDTCVVNGITDPDFVDDTILTLKTAFNENVNDDEYIHLYVSKNLLFREMHIIKWNRIEEWF